jgi:hypothetical protein
MALTEIDLSNVIGGNSALTSDRRHEIAGLGAVASADGHEEPGHSARTCGTGPGCLRRSRASHRRLVCLSHSSLRSFPLEHVESRGGQFYRVKLLE